MLTAVATYQTNNAGNLPTELTADMLQGLGYYTGATIARGEQDPLTTDQMRLVTGARCLADGGTTTGSR
jgi:hypothetical protein